MIKKTKSITVSQFDYLLRNVHDEELDIHGHLNHYTELDESGNPLKEIMYAQDGSFEEMIDYVYNESGQLIRELYYPEEDVMAEELVFRHDDSGKIVQASKHYQDGSVDTIDFEYNSAGQVIRKTTKNDDQEIEQTEEFQYDGGSLVRHETYDGEGLLMSVPFENSGNSGQTRVTQNENGQVTLEEELDDNGEVFMSVKRCYNAEGQPDEVEVFIDGQGSRITRHYILKYEYTYYE